MSIFDSITNITDAMQGGLIDIGEKSITKKSNQYTTTSQDTYAPVSSYDYTNAPIFTFAPQYMFQSAGATQSSSASGEFVKKTDLTSTPSQVATQTPMSLQGAINPSESAKGGIMDNVSEIATIGLIGAGVFVAYNIFVKKKRKK